MKRGSDRWRFLGNSEDRPIVNCQVKSRSRCQIRRSSRVTSAFFYETKPTEFWEGLHPQKLTWNLEMMVSNRNLLFQGSIFRFHVCFGGFNEFTKKTTKLPRSFQQRFVGLNIFVYHSRFRGFFSKQFRAMWLGFDDICQLLGVQMIIF